MILIHMIKQTREMEQYTNYFCSPPPPVSTTIRVDQPDRCYLYRAIAQKKTDLAIDWLNRWKDKELTSNQDRSIVLFECIKTDNVELIKYLLEQKLATEDQVTQKRMHWHQLFELNGAP